MDLVDLHLLYWFKLCPLALDFTCQLSPRRTWFHKVWLVALHLLFESFFILLHMLWKSLHILFQLLYGDLLLDLFPLWFLLISFQNSLPMSPLLFLLSEFFLKFFSYLSLFGSFLLPLLSFQSPLSLEVFNVLWEILFWFRNLHMEIFDFVVFELVWAC